MKSFTAKETNIAKGVACILLLIHHLFYSQKSFDLFYHTFGIENKPLAARIASIAKICVAIFVILSGYGLSKSAEKNKDSDAYFTYRHLVKLFCQYWFIFVIFVPMGFLFGRNPVEIYGLGIKGVIKLLIDFIGLANLFNTPTMNGTWWYMGAAVILYLLFPIFYKAVKKNWYISLIVSFAILVFGTLAGRWYHAIITWIFPFITGIFLAQKGFLDRIAAARYRYCIAAASFVLSIFTAAIRYLVNGMALRADTFVALSIIVFTITFLSNLKYINTALEFIGKHSANIFMMHTFIYLYYFQTAIYAAYYPSLIVLVLLAVSLTVSVGLEKLKKLVRYEKLNKLILNAGGFLK